MRAPTHLHARPSSQALQQHPLHPYTLATGQQQDASARSGQLLAAPCPILATAIGCQYGGLEDYARWGGDLAEQVVQQQQQQLQQPQLEQGLLDSIAEDLPWTVAGEGSMLEPLEGLVCGSLSPCDV